MALTVRTIHRGRLFSVYDCACRAETREFSPKEDVEVTQLVIARTGHFVRRVGEREIGHDAGSASVFVAGETHTVRHPHEAGDRCTSIAPNDAALEPLLRAAQRSPRRSVPLAPGASFLVARLTAAEPRAVNDPLALEESGATLFSAIVAALLRARRRGPRENRDRHRIVERARDFLAATYRERVDLATIAAESGASPFHLCRVFKDATGRTLAQHRTALRLLAALDAIESGADDLTALALSLGFADHAHFTNAFRRAFGAPPSFARRRPDRAELRELSNRLQAELGAKT